MKFKTTMKLLTFIGIIITIIIIGFPYYTAGSIIEGTVISKEVKKINDIDIYQLYIKDKEGKSNTYKIEDTIAYMQFASSNLYGEVSEGDTINIKYYGVRIPFLSKYKNIYNIKILSHQVENIKEQLENYGNQLKDNNIDILYFYEANNIYKYNINTKKVELYDSNILK